MKLFDAVQIPVDTATIIVADKSYYGEYAGTKRESKDYQGRVHKTVEVFNVKPGRYRVAVVVEDKGGWADKKLFSRTKVMEITSGEIWVSDPCQAVVDEKWEDFLRVTKYFKKRHDQAIVINTGADGGYDVHVAVEEEHR